MKRKGPRLSARLQKVNELVEQDLGDQVICARCGATLQTFGKTCAADLDDACQGFLMIDAAKMRADKLVTGS